MLKLLYEKIFLCFFIGNNILCKQWRIGKVHRIQVYLIDLDDPSRLRDDRSNVLLVLRGQVCLCIYPHGGKQGIFPNVRGIGHPIIEVITTDIRPAAVQSGYQDVFRNLQP